MHYASMGINVKNKIAMANAPPYIERREILSSTDHQSVVYPIKPLLVQLEQNQQKSPHKPKVINTKSSDMTS